METLLPRSESPPLNPYQSPLSPPALQWKMSWWVPRWSNWRGYKMLVRSLIYKGYALRLALIVLVVNAAIGIPAKIAIPQIGFDFVWQALLADAFLFAVLPAIPLISIYLPKKIYIREDGAVRYSEFYVIPRDIQSAQIVVLSTDLIQLVIRAKGELHKVAVAPGTDIGQLASLLVSAEVMDMKRHFVMARALVGTARKP